MNVLTTNIDSAARDTPTTTLAQGVDESPVVHGNTFKC